MTKARDLQQNVKKEAEHLLTELRTLADEIRSRAQLANAKGCERYAPKVSTKELSSSASTECLAAPSIATS